MIPIHAVETKRLVLGQWSEVAIAALHAMHNDPQVQRYLAGGDKGWTMQMAQDRVAIWQKEFATAGLGKFPIWRRDNGEFVGRAGFSLLGGTAPELGYSLVSAHWGQGYATEIAEGLRDWFFANREEDSFIAFAHVENSASQRILEKIGMIPTHVGEFADMPHQFYSLDRAKP